jgi:anti-sigma factor RsiW
MNCEEVLRRIESAADGKLSSEEARAVRDHMTSCPGCAARLGPSAWVEILPALDATIEPSEDFARRFREKLRARPQLWWKKIANWGWPRQLAAAGILTAIILAGIFVLWHPGNREDRAAYFDDITVAENLPLLEDMPVINNMDLLEDFDTIENLPHLMKAAAKN